MKRINLVLFSFFFLYTASAQKFDDIKVIAYFSGHISQLDSIDVNKITHLIFCFGHLDGHRYKIDNAKDSALIKKMVSLKSKNQQLKVILSLGGWGGCETCSDAFFTTEGRKEFVLSVKEVNDYFKTDGIDLDWEYPTVRLDNDIDKEPVHKTTPQDRENFTDLVRKLRQALGSSNIISFAAGGFNTYLQKAVAWKEVMKEVDFINLMSYDLINGYATETGHHTALYSTSKQIESTDNAVQYLLKIGVDPKKIIIGAAFYARVWENVSAKNNGLYQSGKFKEAIAYNEFAKKMSEKNSYQFYWDDKAKAPYAYNAVEKKFATYDDQRSIALKINYVSEHQLGGIMFWEISNDIFKGGLVDVIHQTKKDRAYLKK